MIKKVFLIPFFLLSGLLITARAQETPPHDLVSFDANSGIPIVQNSFTNMWDAAPAIHLNIRFPYYAGQIESGIRYIRFHGKAPTETNSDYHSFFIHIGYSYPFYLSRNFQIAPTLRIGNNLMLFDEPEVYTSGSFRYETDPFEMEFAYELALRNQLRITKHWSMHVTISYNRTLTRFPLPVTMISAGVSYNFAEPKWLKNFLR